MIKDTILIVDDEPDFLHVLKKFFTLAGFQVKTAHSAEKALSMLAETPFDAVVSDMALPGKTGLDLLKKIRLMDGMLPVLIMTGVGTIESAVEAIQHGAFHYITKPFNPVDLENLVARAIESSRMHRRLAQKDKAEEDEANGIVVGHSKQIRDVLQTIEKVAISDAPMLIQGETGTGKSMIARTIHDRSSRKNREFLTIDCASLAENLLESELFGHVKGAFTGAVSAKRGLLEEAQGGTIFLDEIGELPTGTQVKLLRAIQEREIKPVGGNKSVSVEVRFVSATSRDLHHEIETGRFRKDLFYRLSVIPLYLPALRERKEDLPLFVNHFVNLFNSRYRKNVTRIDPCVLHMFMNAQWKGNIRELENTIERAVLLTDNQVVTMDSLSIHVQTSARSYDNMEPILLKQIVEEAEKSAIVQVLQATAGNRTLAAKRLGIARRTLYDKLSAYGLE